MPIYEYYCSNNNKVYSFYAKSMAQGESIPRCPNNPKFSMKKMISGFSVTGKKGDSEKDGGQFGDDLDDPRLGAAMAEMEREVSGMDEENPDPRQMGRLMRKMAEISGERMPESMEEMMRRLEAGEDPEKLEEEFGDVLEEELPEGETDTLDSGATGRAKTRRRAPPLRDPTLYDLEDFI